MTSTLRALDGRDADRAAAVARFVDRYNSSPETKRTLVSSLKGLARLTGMPNGNFYAVEWELFAYDEPYSILEDLMVGQLGRASAAKYRWALNGLLRHLARRQLADHDVLAATLIDRGPRPPKAAPQSRAVSPDELLAMLRSCHRDGCAARGDRDAALLAVLAGTGARRSEVARLSIGDLDTRDGTVTFLAKGRQERVAVLLPSVLDHVERWLAHHPSRSGPLWLPIRKDGAVQPGAAISDRTVHRVVANRRDQAGAHERIGVHSFRHFFVTSLLSTGADVLTAMRAVGHRHPSTTSLYDKRVATAIRGAVDRLYIPSIGEVDDSEHEPP